MAVLRILPYHAGKIPDYLEKQPHKMSFYCDLVIICEGNERAGQAGLEIMHKAFFLRNESERCRSFLQRSQGWLGKLLFETGYFPAKPRITYIFFFVGGKKWAWRKGRERVSSRPPAGALEGLLLPSEENPSPPRHPGRKMLKRII